MSGNTNRLDPNGADKSTSKMNFVEINSGKEREQPSKARNDGTSDNLGWVRKDNSVRTGRHSSRQMSRGGSSKHFDHKPSSDYSFQQKSRGAKDLSSGVANNTRWVPKDNSPSTGSCKSTQMSSANCLNHIDDKPSSDDSFPQESPGVKDISSGMANLRLMPTSPEMVDYSSEQLKYVPTSGSEFKGVPSLSAQSEVGNEHLSVVKSQKVRGSELETEICTNIKALVDTDSMPKKCMPVTKSGMKDESSEKGSQSGQISLEKAGSSGIPENFNSVSIADSFDICPKKPGVVKLKAPLHVKNREKRTLIKRSMEGQKILVLRPGMVLLKSYICGEDQISMVKRCRECGIGKGGFYEPGYRDGAKLHLKMMCLGMNWDPDTGKYDKVRPVDGATPPDIPHEFHELVKTAMLDSHAHLQKQAIAGNVEKIIPLMSPNICIVNYYATVGRLGLHQDKDESPSSLKRGLPVVSFSIGDSAKFLYSDKCDVEGAKEVVLESGDVLIFGGKSRHVFHGVSSIIPNTAPSYLLEETDFLPGRLNLTFREY